MPAERPMRPANSTTAELRSDDIEVAHAMAALDSE